MIVRKWLPEEIEILHAYAFAPMREVLEKLPGRTSNTIYWKLGLLGYKRDIYKRYSVDEDSYIKENCAKMGNRAIAKVLKRSEKSITKRMITLGIKRTDAEISKIRSVHSSCFQKGRVSEKKMAQGNLQLCYDDRTKTSFYNIKIGNRFKRFSRYLYEHFNGVVLKSSDIVFHADGDAMNLLKENLILIDRKDLLDKNINTDEAFVKRILGVKNAEAVEKFIAEKPEIIEMKRNQLMLQSKLIKSGRKQPI